MITVEGKEGNTFIRDVSVAKKLVQPPCTTESQPIAYQNIADELKPNLKVYPKRNRTPSTQYITVKNIFLMKGVV